MTYADDVKPTSRTHAVFRLSNDNWKLYGRGFANTAQLKSPQDFSGRLNEVVSVNIFNTFVKAPLKCSFCFVVGYFGFTITQSKAPFDIS